MNNSETARSQIRRWRRERARRVVVLDDDPTGSQSVHDVEIVSVLSKAEIAAALDRPASIAFLLTNTRGLPEQSAVDVTRTAVTNALGLGHDLDLVSRSDSTLRGHVVAEVRVIDEVREQIMGRGFDGVLLAPAFFEAGRFTEGDIHYATIRERPVPVGKTEFARDATFGYRSSDLREFLIERSGGAIRAADVLSIRLEDIAEGAERVRDILLEAHDRRFVIVNATDYTHYETVVLGVQAAIDLGRSFLYRTGPSFIRALTGVEPRPPLIAADFPQLAAANGRGVIVVGSHVKQTSRQVARVRQVGGLVEHELSVEKILTADRAYLAAAIREVREALADHDVLVYTSRDFVRGATAEDSLRIAHTVSDAVSVVIAGAMAAGPAWVIAKGGITSHDVAVHGLGIRRARVLGQLLPGLISVFEPIAGVPEAIGVPYVVFAGNVGDDETLAQVVSVLRAAQGRTADGQ